MPDFSDLVPFIDRTRWLMLQACAAEGVELKKFSKEIGMSEKRIRSILFSDGSSIGDLTLREIAEWFYCSIGRVPEFSVVPMGEWHSRAPCLIAPPTFAPRGDHTLNRAPRLPPY